MSANCMLGWTTLGAPAAPWQTIDPPIKDIASDIERLHAESGLTSWSKKTWQSFLDSSNCSIALCLSEDKSRVLAVCLCKYVADEAELLQIFVDRSVQNQGIGRLLLEASIDLLRIKDTLHLYLEVSEENTSAIGLYSSIGFQITGIRRGYYKTAAGKSVDAMLMRFEL